MTSPSVREMLSSSDSYSSVPAIRGTWIPRYNFKYDPETRSAQYEIALPGYDRSDIEVQCTGKTLTVSSKADPDYSDYHTVSAAVRPFRLSWAIDRESRVSKASFNNGLLVILMESDPPYIVPVE